MVTERVRIEEVDVSGAVREDFGDLSKLSVSINRLGLLQPIIVTKERKLIDGRRRLEAVRSFGDEEWIDCRVVDSVDSALKELEAQRDANECREPLKPTEKLALYERIEAIEPKKKPGPKPADNSGQPVGSNSRARRERIASAAGTSHENIRRIRTVVKAAENDPSLAPVVEKMDETGDVKPAYEAVQAATNPPAPEPENPLDVVRSEALDALLEFERRAIAYSELGGAVDLQKLQRGTGNLRALFGDRKPDWRPEECDLPPELDVPAFREKWREWCKYRGQARKKVSQIAATKQLKVLASAGVAASVEAIDTAIANDWIGVFPGKRGANPARQGAGQKYDPEAAKKDPKHGKF